MKKELIIVCLFCYGWLSAYNQPSITQETFIPYVTYFTLDEDHNINGEGRQKLIESVGDNQFIGLAEVHQSQQLSYFTTGFLQMLSEKGFNHFALELGPISAQIVQELSTNPSETEDNLNKINRTYGKKKFPKIPLIFVDKVEDALFVRKAFELDYEIWGLDQEFAYSYEMHLDRMYDLMDDKSEELEALYLECKKLFSKNIFKSKVSGQTKNCWFGEEPTIREFFKLTEGNSEAKSIADALSTTWDIYCRNEQRLPSNQVRADYMKSNFEHYYGAQTTAPKVFVKLGGVHLTRGISVFGVNDMGKYLNEKGNDLNTGFLTIRHFRRFKNGKDMAGKGGWKNVGFLMRLGHKDKWTLVDLRPLRKPLMDKELATDKYTHFEIMNYDLLLISPDDKNGKLNY